MSVLYHGDRPMHKSMYKHKRVNEGKESLIMPFSPRGRRMTGGENPLHMGFTREFSCKQLTRHSLARAPADIV